MPDRRDGGRERRSAVVYPFLGCVSHAAIENGRCGHCLWYGTECRASIAPEMRGASPDVCVQGDLPYYAVTDQDWVRPDRAAAVAAQEQRYEDGHRQGRM